MISYSSSHALREISGHANKHYELQLVRQFLSFPRSFDLTEWMSTNAQLNALVSRRLPCHAGWINFKVRQNKPVLQCFNLLGAPVHVTKLSASPVGFLRMYLNHQHRNTQTTERTFNILQFRVRVSICLFHFTYCQVFWVFQGSGSGFPGFKTCQLFTWLSFLQSQITHKNVSVLSGSHLRDMLLTLIFQKSKILFAYENSTCQEPIGPWTCLLSLGQGPWTRTPHWGKKEKNLRGRKKKKSAKRVEPRGSLGRGKERRLRSPIFFLLDPVFCLFSPLRSLVPGYCLVIFSDHGTIKAKNHLLYENELWVKRKLLSV